jgi:hypothetical protein
LKGIRPNLPPTAILHHGKQQGKEMANRRSSPVSSGERPQSGIKPTIHAHTPLPLPLRPATPAEERGREAGDFNGTGRTNKLQERRILRKETRGQALTTISIPLYSTQVFKFRFTTQIHSFPANAPLK